MTAWVRRAAARWCARAGVADKFRAAAARASGAAHASQGSPSAPPEAEDGCVVSSSSCYDRNDLGALPRRLLDEADAANAAKADASAKHASSASASSVSTSHDSATRSPALEAPATEALASTPEVSEAEATANGSSAQSSGSGNAAAAADPASAARRLRMSESLLRVMGGVRAGGHAQSMPAGAAPDVQLSHAGATAALSRQEPSSSAEEAAELRAELVGLRALLSEMDVHVSSILDRSQD